MANFPIRNKTTQTAKPAAKTTEGNKYETVGFGRIRKRKKDGVEFIALSMTDGTSLILTENPKYDPADDKSFAYFVNKESK